MRKIISLISIICLFACSKEVMFDSYPCVDGDCNALIQLDPLVSPGLYLDGNGYWNIEYNGIRKDKWNIVVHDDIEYTRYKR